MVDPLLHLSFSPESFKLLNPVSLCPFRICVRLFSAHQTPTRCSYILKPSWRVWTMLISVYLKKNSHLENKGWHAGSIQLPLERICVYFTHFINHYWHDQRVCNTPGPFPSLATTTQITSQLEAEGRRHRLSDCSSASVLSLGWSET